MRCGSWISFQTPSIMCRSVRHRPAAPTRMMTSSDCVIAAFNVSILSSTFIFSSYSYSRAAFIRAPPHLWPRTTVFQRSALRACPIRGRNRRLRGTCQHRRNCRPNQRTVAAACIRDGAGCRRCPIAAGDQWRIDIILACRCPPVEIRIQRSGGWQRKKCDELARMASQSGVAHRQRHSSAVRDDSPIGVE